ncbi:MAG: hypothetical protein IJR48_04020 [Oscillibacter sp.]|nr:hypothetical protein [Oscillibacter sp.]MBQ7681132.1 hypothetical protein [Oscillibacter sp.]MBQ9617511.1 hypothetical protein [Oscillibacter sp.]
MATKKPRVPVTLEPELFEQVTAYQFRHGITSMSKAIRQLVRIGLGSPDAVRLTENRPRQEPELPAQERELLDAVRGLEPVQKAALLRVLEIAAGSAETGQTRLQTDALPGLAAGTVPAHGHHNS